MALGTGSELSTLLSRTETPSDVVALLCIQPTLMSRSPWVCTFGLFWMTTRADMNVLNNAKDIIKKMEWTLDFILPLVFLRHFVGTQDATAVLLYLAADLER